jgi:thiol-disulfide isomerase/thioredoxin
MKMRPYGWIALCLAVIAIVVIIGFSGTMQNATPAAQMSVTTTPSSTSSPQLSATATVTPSSAPTAQSTAAPPQEAPAPQGDRLDMFAALAESKLDLTPYKGKAIFLNFFTEWCPYCMQEMPAIKTIFNTYSQEELQIILVHVWDGEDERNTESIRQTYGLQDMTFFEDQDMGLARLVGLPGYPTSIFIDKDGYLEAGIPSALSLEQMAQAMESMGVSKAEIASAPNPSPEAIQ